MAESKAKPVARGWRTVLERRPDYLQAIGTVAVEIVNMEAMLAVLLSQILKISDDTADAIYFAPHGTGPRLAIFKGVVDTALAGHPKYQSKATKIADRALSLAGKRHEIVHDSWGYHFDEDETQVSLRALPFTAKKPPRLVPLNEVTATIDRVRDTLAEIVDLTNEIYEDPVYQPSRGTPPGPTLIETPGSISPQEDDPPKP